MILREILRVKGQLVHSIKPSATLADAARKLVECNCGSLIVGNGDDLIGIITERDILRATALLDEPLETIPVESRMTTQLYTANPDDDLELVMGMMTTHRVRHLPVMEDGRLVGIVSIGDVVKAHHDRLCMENEYLKHYIHS